MARIIPFYVPARHRKPLRSTAVQPCGRVLPFRRPVKKTASDSDWRILGITGRRSSHFKIPGT